MSANGVELIADERSRQLTEKGWSKRHDREVRTDRSLAKCAVAILTEYAGPDPGDGPWWWERAVHVMNKYRGDPLRQLQIAGALIAAEIDRVQSTGP